MLLLILINCIIQLVLSDQLTSKLNLLNNKNEEQLHEITNLNIELNKTKSLQDNLAIENQNYKNDSIQACDNIRQSDQLDQKSFNILNIE
jgi:hypothetical protein